LIFSFALNEGRTVFGLVGFRDGIDGQTGTIQGGVGCDIAHLSIIIVDQMFRKAGLAEVN
jgi:hypothetical protein